MACVAGLAVLVVMRGYAGWANAAPGGAPQALSVPERVGVWTLADAPAAWRGDFRGADRQGAWVYRDGDREVTLYVAYYAYERPGAELVASANSLLGDDPATDLMKRGRASYGAFDGLPAPTYLHLRGPAYPGGRVVWSWYRVGAAVTASGPVAKLETLKAKLLGTAAPSLAIAVSTAAGPAAGETLSDFLAGLDGLTRIRLIPTDDRPRAAAR
ncbi:MAG: EpsI family protein [Rhodovibrio sp.]|nr:EpsI family protein [Rhodovibrio sp.]